MSRISLATDVRTRAGNPDKDARMKNAYIELRGEQSAARKRPSAQGGVPVGLGTPQGGYGLVLFWGDIAYPITANTGTTWNGGTGYNIGDHVSLDFTDYWATAPNTGSMPPSVNWSRNFVAPVPSPHTYATFSTHPAAITLSGGNLVVTIGNAFVLGGCLTATYATFAKTTGKWYWEVTLTAFSGFDVISKYVDIGVSSSSLSISRYVGFQASGYSYGMITQTAASSKGHANVISAYGSAMAQGDVIGVALDMDAGTLTFYKNGVSQGVAYSGLTGAVCAAIGGIANSADATDIVLTANFGAMPFAFSVPAGFNAGLYI